MLRAHLHCAGEASQVAVARRFIRATLAGWGAARFEWTAEMLVSELATNAIIHARTDFGVTVSLADGSLVLEVADNSPLRPVRRRFGSTATTGRGMRLVQELASSWSFVIDGDAKVVTCTVTEADAARRFPGRDEPVDVAAFLSRFAADEHGADPAGPHGRAGKAAA